MGLEENRLPVFLALPKAGFSLFKPFLKTCCLTCLRSS